LIGRPIAGRVDLSRRNNLLSFRELKVGTLDISDAPAEDMQALLQSGASTGEGVRLRTLISEDRRTQAEASLAEIDARARANFEEKGLNTLFVALGLASWTASDGGRDAASPVLLIPIEATPIGKGGQWSLKRSGEVTAGRRAPRRNRPPLSRRATARPGSWPLPE
jgi:hypothetical protein